MTRKRKSEDVPTDRLPLKNKKLFVTETVQSKVMTSVASILLENKSLIHATCHSPDTETEIYAIVEGNEPSEYGYPWLLDRVRVGSEKDAWAMLRVLKTTKQFHKNEITRHYELAQRYGRKENPRKGKAPPKEWQAMAEQQSEKAKLEAEVVAEIERLEQPLMKMAYDQMKI